MCFTASHTRTLVQMAAETENSKDSTDSQLSSVSNASSTRAIRLRNKSSGGGQEDDQVPVRETRRKAQLKEKVSLRVPSGFCDYLTNI